MDSIKPIIRRKRKKRKGHSMSTCEVFTVSETAEILKTSRNQVRAMISKGLLYAVKVGREYCIPAESINFFIQSK